MNILLYKELDISNSIEINSVSTFIDEIKKLKDSREGSSAELYFRGQETEFWDIEPSIFRDDMLSIEHKLMQIPLQKTPAEFREFNSMFDIMTKYQHYGMCTRLLDLTTNPLVGLYFACKLHGNEEYNVEGTKVKKEPYGIVYYTDKYYPSHPSNQEVQIVSALASYDLTKENTLVEVLGKLMNDNIIDIKTKDRWLQKEYFKEFVKIIQSNYMVMPTYTNERLRKQCGVFLLASLFSFNESADIYSSIISKTKGKLKNDFNEVFFYINGEKKEEILNELDLYNINEATLFPELEHQLNYIKYTNRNQVKPVDIFIKFDSENILEMKEIYCNQDIIDKYIIDNLAQILESIDDIENIEPISNILRSNFSIDWYKRERVLSKIKIGIAGYFTKTYGKDVAKEKAEYIVSLIVGAIKKLVS